METRRYLDKECYYRAWIGMRLPLGEYNKMYNYTIEQSLLMLIM